MAEKNTIERVMITGATGYLGGHVARLCLEREISVIALVREGRSNHLPDELECITTTLDGVADVMTGFTPDAVLHLAAWSGMQHKAEQVADILSSNIALGTHLLEAAVSIPRQPVFIWAGSYWQYAHGGKEPASNSLYAASKQAFSTIIDYYRQCRGARALGLILHDIYGEDDNRGRILNLIAHALTDTSDPLDLSDGSQPISFVHVRDAANAFIHAAEHLLAGFEIPSDGVYAVATSQAPLRQQIEGLLSNERERAQLHWGARPQPDNIVRALPDIEPLPGWTSHISLEEGFGRMVLNG